MNTIADIDRKIKELEDQLEQIEGRPTEVYSRIVGYYRSLRNWNRGKREEYSHRVVFDSNVPEHAGRDAVMVDPVVPGDPVATTKATQAVTPEPSTYEEYEPKVVEYVYFYRETCPNCPPVRNLLSRLELPGLEIDVDTDEGSEAALEYGIYAAPTVVFFDAARGEVFRASSVEQLSGLKIPQIA